MMESTLDGLLLRDPSSGMLVPAMGDEAGPVLAVLFVRSGVGGVDRFPVRATTARLGRAPDNDVVLVAPSVALEHAELRLRGGLWSLRDLGASGGSLVDGAGVAGAALLAPGSEIQLGEVRLAFDPQDRWDDSPVEMAEVVEAAAPAVELVEPAEPVVDLDPSRFVDDDEPTDRTRRFREASTPFLVMPESEAPSRRVWFIAAVAVVAIIAIAYFLLQAR
ncbi:MAG: FHA domain-containing protein [Gemmatimonadales bacterium]